ncbi:fibroblast growth factor 6 isoform X1 [Moschus berezovskii]|uniref:fibroblast growth factor 6 isoform X1 n=1 Tax=Moschus berezovskii TaxID=68408 RepID=UPI00244515C8|nr:fibroblast growth factor 6 isoform X1 [Moschus berezovskii]
MARGQTLLITMSRGAGRPQGTLRALVFLGVLVGMVVPSPTGTRANGTLLASRGWGTLLSRSRAGLAGEIAGVNWESGYLVGIKRQRRLYCNVGIGFHLQVPPDGRISGTHEEDPYSLLEISTVERGVVSLFGVKSALFVAMNSKGKLYATGFPGGSDGKESACNAEDPGSQAGKIPWRREWLPTPVLWPGESHGQRSLAGYSPRGYKESDTTEPLTLSLFFC